MSRNLSELREILLLGIRLSNQTSYQRQAPAKESLPYLSEAVVGLREGLQTDPNNADAWRLLSQGEECLLQYRKALESLERCLALSGRRSKSDLKRLARLKAELEQANRPLFSDEASRDLTEFLLASGVDSPQSGVTLERTVEWLERRGYDDVEAVLAKLHEIGAHTDFDVLKRLRR